MKKISVLLFVLLLILAMSSFAQNDGGVSIGKGSNPANQKSILELVSKTKGLLIPRMTDTERNAIFNGADQTAKGLMVFDDTRNAFYFWDGSAWKAIASGNVMTVSGTPSTPGATGELVFDTQNSLLYIYDGGKWLKVGSDNANSALASDVKVIPNTTVGLSSVNVQDALLELQDKIKTASGGGMNSVIHDASFSGSGTVGIPLTVAPGGITGSHLKDAAVTAAKISGGGNNKVLATDGSGTTVWIDKSSLGGGGGNSSSVITDKTLTGDGTASFPLGLKDGMVTASKISGGGIDKILTTDGTGNAVWIDKSSLGGGGGNSSSVITDKTLTGDGTALFRLGLASDAVTTDKIAFGAITSAKIEDDAVNSSKIHDFAITTAKIEDGAVSTSKIAFGAATAEKIGYRAVTTEKIEEEAVTSSKILDGTIQAKDLGDMNAQDGYILQWKGGYGWLALPGNLGTGGGITRITPGTGLTGGGSAGDVTLGLSDGGVSTSKIADGAIQASKLGQMGATASGQVLQWDGSAWKPATISGGTGGTVSVSVDGTLKGNGTAASPLGLANGAIQSANLASMGATTSQVLQWDGSAWKPATISGGTGSGTNLSATTTGSSMTINSSTGTSTAIIPIGSTSSAGLMTASDKIKLDAITGNNTGDQDLTSYALKANVLERTNTGVFTPTGDYQPATKKYVDDHTGFGSIAPTTILGNKLGSTAAPTALTTTEVKTMLALTRTDVGLGNVDNTSDLAKPVSTAMQTALDGKVDKNANITAGTATKITYDSKGLVTAGVAATTADITSVTDKRYVTEAQLGIIGNISGINTGDMTLLGQNYLTLSGQKLTAGAVDLSGTHATGILAAARFPALSGDVTTAEGSLVTTLKDVVTAGTYRSVTTDSKGRVISGANPTKLEDYGITGTVTGDVLQWDASTSKWINKQITPGNESITFAPTGDVTGTATGTTSLTPSLIIGAGKVVNSMLATGIDGSKITGTLPNVTGINGVTISSTPAFTLSDGTKTLTIAGNSSILGTNTGDQILSIDNGTVKISGASGNSVPVVTKLIAGSGLTGTGTTGDVTLSLGTNAIKVVNLQGSSGALAPANATSVLRSNADGTFSWLDIASGSLPVDPSSITLADKMFFIGNGLNKASEIAKSSISLSGFGVPTEAINMGIKQINNLAAPTADNDAVTKKYVDDLTTNDVQELGGNKYYTDARANEKENVANKTGSITIETDDTKYPSVKAIKSYVDAKVPSTAAGDNGKVLSVVSGVPTWQTVTGGGGVQTISFDNTSGNGITGSVNITDAANPVMKLTIGNLKATTLSTTGDIIGSNIPSGSTISGNNTGDQTISFAPVGGDVTSLTVSSKTSLAPTLTIVDKAITPAKLNVTGTPNIGSTLTYSSASGFAWGSSSATTLTYTPGPAGATLASSSGNTVTIGLVDASNAGLMKPSDLTKLTGLSNYILPAATTTSLGGVKVAATSGLAVAGDGSLTANISTDGTFGSTLDTNFPSTKAVKTYVDGKVAAAGGGDAMKSLPLSQFASTTSAELAGVISNETGSAAGGVLVFSNSPTLTTPTLSAAAGTAPFIVTSTTPVTNLSIGGNAATATTATNIAGGDAGQILYQSAAGITSKTAAGISGQVLTSNGTGAPTWTTPTGGGDMLMASIQSVTGLKTFDNSKLAMKGTGTGITTISSANATGTFTLTLPAANGTVALSTSPLDQFATTTSAQLAGVISNETGSAAGGVLVFSNSPTLTTPTFSAAAGTAPFTVTSNAPVTNLSIGGNAATATTATTATNIAGGTAGDIFYQSAAGTTAKLALGSLGQVLTSNGAGAPTWTTPTSGGSNPSMSYTPSATNGVIQAGSGTTATLPAVTPTAGTNLAGLMIPADKTKLDKLPTVTNAPEAGQVLTATSPTSATWQAPATGGGGSSPGYFLAPNASTGVDVQGVIIKGTGSKVTYAENTSGTYGPTITLTVPSNAVMDYARINFFYSSPMLNAIHSQSALVIEINCVGGVWNQNAATMLLPQIFFSIYGDAPGEVSESNPYMYQLGASGARNILLCSGGILRIYINDASFVSTTSKYGLAVTLIY